MRAAKGIHRLSAVAIGKLQKPGLHADGGGLYLRIGRGRRWVFIYNRPSDGKRCEIGLGPAPSANVADPGSASTAAHEARSNAAAMRESLRRGIDPKDAIVASRHVGGATFGELADAVVSERQAGWRNAKSAPAWRLTLTTYAGPIRSLPVAAITTDDVLSVLRPIWQTKPETARRLRARIEHVLDVAKVRGLRSSENPARWKGHLSLILGERQRRPEHHPALNYRDLPEFMRELRARPSVAAFCLEFLILTAARSGEALGATWEEVDLSAGVWTVPAARMKGGAEHAVPLSSQAKRVLSAASVIGKTGFIFPGQRRDRPLSNMALSMALRRMRRPHITVHGFRSSFRDWAGNATEFPRELAEHALAHSFGNRAEQAYRRETAVERRRPMMQAWGDWCDSALTEHPSGGREEIAPGTPGTLGTPSDNTAKSGN